jgi:hypothetical protein
MLREAAGLLDNPLQQCSVVHVVPDNLPDIPATGISPVKRFIEAHGGKIMVESEGTGKCTTF